MLLFGVTDGMPNGVDTFLLSHRVSQTEMLPIDGLVMLTRDLLRHLQSAFKEN